MKYQYLILHCGNDNFSNKRTGRSHPRDPLPALSFATSHSADAVVLTVEVCTRVGDVCDGGGGNGDVGGRDWLRLCRVKVGNV